MRGSLLEATDRLRGLFEQLDQVLRGPEPDETPGPLALTDSVERVAALLRLRRSNVTLRIEQPPGAPPPAVHGVHEHLQHALLNLLMNAYEALAGRRSGTVTMSVDATDDVVRIAVADDGPGVAPEVAARLFQPFVTTRRDRPLAGLGLYVSRTLLERSGGRLYYESPGTGARFVAELRSSVVGHRPSVEG